MVTFVIVFLAGITIALIILLAAYSLPSSTSGSGPVDFSEDQWEERIGRWLDRNRKTIFWSVVGVLSAPIITAAVIAVFWGVLLLLASHGLVHLELDR